MLESFLFPASMAAGVALVSSPIIIHLINRMRFKRMRWAAMEFLLKSQKRNRRRLIIEQLILLLLRILLVLLIALIVARFIGWFFGPIQPQTTQHLILLDDTASMHDQWLENGERRTSFQEACRLITDEIARSAAKASKAQHLKVITATQPDVVRYDQRLNEQSIRDLGNLLATLEATALHVELLPAVRKARQLLEATPQDQRILYLVSDFRRYDWSGPGGDRLIEALQELRKQEVYVKFVDVAHPVRKPNEKDAAYHDNLAIVGLQPEARVTARNRLTEFTVTVFNYGSTERRNVQVRVKVNGQERLDRSVVIPVVRPGEKAEATFHDYLDQLGVNQISANLDPEETGLLLDNTRYAVVEVRERIPILLIDGDPVASDREGGDSYFLNILFNANRGIVHGYDLRKGTLSDLERSGLDSYPSIYLVNVRELNDKALANLESYVRQGGNVGFFLGERVNPEFYNRKLYNQGNGIFPVPLADRPSPELTPEEKDQRLLANLAEPHYQLFVRDPTHPIFAAVWDEKVRAAFMFLNIDRYYPVPRARWREVPGKTQELATLPNRRSVDDYKDTTQDLLARLQTILDKQANQKYRARFAFYRDTIRDVLGGRPLHKLAETLDRMLHDRGEPNNPDLPDLMPFWGQGDRDVDELRQRFEQLRDTVQYGDPLLVLGRVGKGRVAAFLTSAGRKWNNWTEFPVGGTYVPMMIELQKWLTGGTSADNFLVGTTLRVQLDATRYEDRMRRIYRPEARDRDAPPAAPAEAGLQPGDVLMGPEQRATTITEGQVHFQFGDAIKPGVYILEFTPKTEEGPSERREPRGYAFNIDTDAESNLLRVESNLLLDKVDRSQLYTLGSDQFTELEQRQRDLSEGPWLFVLFLLVLVLEQAMAVHLSFHLRGTEGTVPVRT